jgi:hypothetical protein
VCVKIGAQLTQSEELLLRHVRPVWLDDEGHPSSQAFWPFRDIDECCLSTDRAALTTPQASHQLFTSPQPAGCGETSAGVWALAVSEVQAVGLTAWEDPAPAWDARPANPFHAVIEFGESNQSQQKKLGKRLKIFACARGKLYP